MFGPHYKPKSVSEVDPKRDSRISLLGRVVEKSEDGFVLEDESGKIKVFFEGDVKEGSIVRAFCTILDESVKADIVQSMNGLDLKLLKEVEELYEKADLK